MNTVKLVSLILLCTLIIPGSITCTRQTDKKNATVLIRMMDAQDQWFRKKITEFEKANNIKITVATFDRFVDIEGMLNIDRESGTNAIALIKTPKEMVYPLYAKGYMMPLKEAGATADDLKDYTDMALKVGTINGVPYYIPRKLETNTMLFLKSKVTEAVNGWQKYKHEINAIFKAENGKGLTRGYTLEKDPNQWDWYDLAVVAYYWAKTQQKDGLTMPRMAHRGKMYGGTMVEIANKIFQAGGTTKDLLAADTGPVLDALEWEAFFRKNNLYNPGMWEQRWTGGGIWKAMQQGQVYLAFMHQIDAFFIHGVKGNPAMKGYLVNSSDMGMALMPAGASLQLANSRPKRSGGHYSQLAGWWWGIPKNTPDKALSYKLARWITGPEFHSQECATFGMMPVTREVLQNIDKYFRENWKQEVFEIASKQIKSGVREIPTIATWPSIEQEWLTIWDRVVVQAKYSSSGEKGKIDRAYILKEIDANIKEIHGLAKEQLN